MKKMTMNNNIIPYKNKNTRTEISHLFFFSSLLHFVFIFLFVSSYNPEFLQVQTNPSEEP